MTGKIKAMLTALAVVVLATVFWRRSPPPARPAA